MAEKGMSRRKQALEPWRKTQRNISGHNIGLGGEHSERENKDKKEKGAEEERWSLGDSNLACWLGSLKMDCFVQATM